MYVFQMMIFYLFLFSACKNDPYSENADIELIGQTEQEIRVSQEVSLFLRMQSVMQFVEGNETAYEIEGVTPSGDSNIEVFDLPTGAEFDPDKRQLKWNPDFSAGNTGDSDVIYRRYPIRIQLRDVHDNLNFLEKKAVLLVFNSPQDSIIETEQETILKEGEKHRQKITVLDQDTFYSDIQLYALDLPSGAYLEKSKKLEGVFYLNFTPRFNLVTQRFRWSKNLHKDISLTLNVIGKQGHITTKVIHWRVEDVSKIIDVSAPKSLKGIEMISFSVLLRDINGETPPTLTILNKPRDGTFRIKRSIFDKTNTISSYSILWEEVPPSLLGSKKELQFKACGPYYRPNVCNTFSVSIQFESKQMKKPIFYRSRDWPLGSIKKYVLSSSSMQVPLSIYDPETKRQVEKVTIEVSSPNISVNWKSGKLLLSATAVGIYQFNIRAETIYGIEGSESMVVEVVDEVVDLVKKNSSDSEEGGPE